MTYLPLPSRRVLAELHRSLPEAGSSANPVAYAFARLETALAAHAEALAYLDRAEAALIAAQRVVEVVEAVRKMDPAIGETATTSVPERLERHTRGRLSPRRLKRGLGSKRQAYTVRQAREGQLSRQARDVAEDLLSATALRTADIVLKLVVIIAAGEAGPPEATACPWACLRRVLTDLK